MGRIKVTHYRISGQDPNNRPARPFSLALISDMHNEVYRSDADHLIRAIDKEEVSAVLSVGDLLVAKGGRCACDLAQGLLKNLAGRYPIYASNGNHEVRMRNGSDTREAYLEYEKAITSYGVQLLNNRSVHITLQGMRIGLYGLELNNGYYRKNLKEGQAEDSRGGRKPARRTYLKVSDMDELIGRPAEGEYRILLAHLPRYFPVYADWGADLVLAGHIHGGIIRLPLVGGLVGPDPCLFPRYDHGVYKSGSAQMIVSAGLGTHTINLRINNPAELVILDF